MRREDELFLTFVGTKEAAILGEVYDLVAPGLLHTAMHLTSKPADAEDLLQSTFLAVIERADSFDPARGTLSAWMTGILTNHARSFRAAAKRFPDPKRLHINEELTPPERAVVEELEESLGRALAELPKSYRSVVTLRLLHGLSPTEIARALEIPPGTVRSQLQRGMERLRAALPAGHAGGLSQALFALLGPPTRGTAAIRSHVVEHAATLAPKVAVVGAGASLVSTLFGVLVMKKMVILALVLIAAIGWVSLGRDDPSELSRDALVIVPTESSARPEVVQEVAVSQAESNRQQIESPAPVSVVEEPTQPQLERLTGSVVVYVQDADGDAIVDELVVLDVIGEKQSFRPRLALKTNNEGYALFEDVPVGGFIARILRGSESTGMSRAGDVSKVHLRLQDALNVAGTVVDELGRPIAGADIWLSERWRANSGFVVKQADKAGQFELSGVTLDQYVGARAPGYAGSYLQPIRGATGDTVRMRIVLADPCGTVEGRVLNGQGEPVAGALVLVGNERNHTPESGLYLAGSVFVPNTPPEWLTTATDGTYRATSVPIGAVSVQARAAGHATTVTTVEVFPDTETSLDLLLFEGARVRGRVWDGAGEPVARALVRTAGDARSFASSLTYTDANGDYELQGLASGKQTLLAVLERLVMNTEVELTLYGGEVTEWDPVLRGGPRIHGRVLRPSGDPIVGWTVVAMLPDTPRDNRMRSMQTDSGGRFSIEVEDVSVPYTLWAQEPGGWRGFPARVMHDVVASEAALEIVIGADDQAYGTLVAEVVDSSGDPVEEAFLCVWHMQEKIWRELPIEQATGLVEVKWVPTGNVSLEVRSRAFPKMHLGEREVIGASVLNLGRIELSGAGYLVGELRGEIPGDLDLRLTNSEFHSPGTLQRNGATFRSSPLEGGRYQLLVTGDFIAQRRLDVEIRIGEETLVEIDIERVGMRRIVFEGVGGGDPPPSMWLQVSSGTEVVWNSHGVMGTAEGELFADVSVARGSYSFRGGTPDGLSVEGELLVTGFDGSQAPLVARFSKP